MTIEYKDSKRIVKLSSDVVETPTYTANYDDTNTWTKTGTKVTVNETVSGKVNWNFSSNYTSAENHLETTPLGFTLDNEKWVCDFEFNASAFDNSAETFLVVFQENAGDFISTSGDGLACAIYTNKTVRLWKKDGSTHSIDSNSNAITIATGTDYYARFSRTSATVIKFELFTDSARTVHVSGSPITFTFSETIQGLDNLTHCGRSDNVGSTRTYNVSLDNLKIWNGVTSVSSKPTDVQDNSLLVEKDTANRYWFNNNLTFEDDFSSSTGWTTVGSGLSITGGELDANFTGSSDNRIYKDLGFNLENKFISHFDYYQGTVSSGYWNMFSFTSGTSKPFTSSQDQIGAIINLSGYNVLARSYDGSSENTSQSGTISLSANTQYYVTAIRDGTSFEIKVYSDSARTTQVGSTISQTLSTNVSLSLRYFQTGHYIGGSGTPIYQIDNLKIYNGVTTPATWINEFGISNGLIFGGVTGSYADYSDSQYWNGVSWTAGGNLTGNRANGASAGTGNTSARYVNGYNASPAPYPNSNRNESYNGTSWTSDTNHPDATNNKQNNGCGTADNMLVGNGHSNGTGDVNNWYKWTGSWTSVTASGITGHDCSLSGTLTSAIQTKTTSSKTWNGTAWTSVSASGVSRSSANASGTSSSDAFRVMSTGSPPTIVSSELWNGTAWTASGNAVTAKSEAGSTNNFSNNMMIIGGQDPSATQSLSTQEYRKGVFTTGSSISGSRRLSGASG